MDEVKMGNVFTQPDIEGKKRRFWELDFIRGICVILMIFDHVMYSVMEVAPFIDGMLGKTIWEGASKFVEDVYWYGGLRITVRFIVLFFLFTVCGTACTLSRSNVKRGLMCFLVGCGITCVTVIVDRIFDMGISIYFGVLHMLGVSMMLYGALSKLGDLIAKIGKDDKTKKITRMVGDYLAPSIGLILLIVYFSCFFDGLIGDNLVSNVYIEDPQMSMIASLFIDVVRHDDVASSIGGADYWPLLPWAAVVFIGGFIGRGLYHSKHKYFLSKADGKWNKPVCFVGRHALIIYAAHQVVAVALIFLITLLF